MTGRLPPRGIRQNNPGNLRPASHKWVGELPAKDGYCVFDTPENGLRAAAKNLVNQQRFHKLRTIRGIISKYAPPSENDTEAYVDAVSARLGVDDEAELDMEKPDTLKKFLKAVVHHENGMMPYGDDLLDAAVRRALA